MKTRLLTVMVVLTVLFLLSASIVWAQPAPVPKTGQTASSQTGDDGDLEKGVASPSPRFTDNGDGTVTDNLTGLMWAKDANDNGTMFWSEAIIYANNLSLGSECGTPYTDWRLPNIKEQMSLLDYGEFDPALSDGHPFLNVQNSDYWTSTALPYNNLHAYYVSINNAHMTSGWKTIWEFYVWPVRGGN